MGEQTIQSIEIRQLTVGKYSNASLPAVKDGTLMYDTTNHKLMIRANGGWETVTSA